jgi:hypothetical protein
LWANLEDSIQERTMIIRADNGGRSVSARELRDALVGSAEYEAALAAEERCVAKWGRMAEGRAPKTISSPQRERAQARERAKAAGVDLSSSEYTDTLEGEGLQGAALAKMKSRKATRHRGNPTEAGYSELSEPLAEVFHARARLGAALGNRERTQFRAEVEAASKALTRGESAQLNEILYYEREHGLWPGERARGGAAEPKAARARGSKSSALSRAHDELVASELAHRLAAEQAAAALRALRVVEPVRRGKALAGQVRLPGVNPARPGRVLVVVPQRGAR